jgi:hypothetical protein
MIYLVNAENTNLYKIGYTSVGAETRLKALQTGSPHKLNIIKQTDGSISKEKYIQNWFYYKKTRGEWFEFNDVDVKNVIDMMVDKKKYWTETKIKTKLLSFRTNINNEQYLRRLMESDERSMSYIISKMIKYFRKQNITDVRDITENL